MNKHTYTPEEVEALVQEAIEKSERSFGGTFKRLQDKNYKLAEALKRAIDHLKPVLPYPSIDELEKVLAQAKG